jgi:hypothetical protein
MEKVKGKAGILTNHPALYIYTINTNHMATLLEDITTQADWIAKAFAEDKLKLDYSIRSFMEIDRFFNKHAKDGQPVPGGRLSQNLGAIIFSLGSYVGQTIIKTMPGSVWETDDNDPEGEVNAAVKLPDGATIWPMQRVMKRFQHGSEDSVYAYGHTITKDITQEPFDQRYWEMEKAHSQAANKQWWKFW